MKTRKIKRGRPVSANPKQPLGLRVAQDVKAYLATKDNQSVFVEDIIRKTAGFKRWATTQ